MTCWLLPVGRRSKLEELLALQLRAMRAPAPVREYRFAEQHVGPGPGIRLRLREAGLKDWRFDFAWPDKMLGVEVEGGAHVGGRHTRGVGFTEDCLKYHHAMALGWTIYRCEGRLVERGDAARLIEKLLGGGA